jgi:hypothetical protein
MNNKFRFLSRKLNNSAFSLQLNRIWRIFTILVFLTAMLGTNATPVKADAGWTAYNDCSGTTSGNTTAYTVTSGSTTGLLKNYDTGANTSVTVTFSSSGSPSVETQGAYSSSGTDAYTTFYNKANMAGVIRYGSSGYWVDMTLTGLDPAKTYTFATTANRAGSTYASRISRFTLSGDDGAVNASTSGVNIIDDHSVYFSTGLNTTNGYVARWTGIQPGSDGSIVVRVQEQTAGNSAYGPSVFMLQEEASTGPTISTTGELSAFNAQPGVASAAQTYTVAGSNLTDDIHITAPAGFELSTDGSVYSSSLILSQSDGSVSATTVYVRLYSATEDTFSGNITHTSSGATDVNLAVGGVVSLCLDISLVAVDDAYLSSANTTNNYGVQTYLRATLSTSSPRGSLLKWDLSSIPANATVSDASLTLNVSTAASQTYYLYNMRQAWVEGTGAGSVTEDGATWQTYDGTNAWGTNGAANVSTDRYDTNLWDADASSFSSIGSKTVSLNTEGIAAVQGWITNESSNNGVTIQNYASSSTSYDLQISSNNHATQTNRPRLNITYCLSTDPTIMTTGTMSAFSSQPGVPSAVQTYAVAGSNLGEDISITAPAGFEISTNSADYYSNLTLTMSGGSVLATTIYVRLNSATEGTFSGNIIHKSSGAAQKAVAVSGTISNIATVTFQYGTSEYTGTVDTFIRGTTAGDTNFSADTGLEWDDNSNSTTDEIALIRFTDIFISEGGPIPDGATITSASLTYMTTDLNSTSTAEGDPANVYESLVDWTGTTITWNNFGGESGVQTDEYNSTLVDSAIATARSTQYTIDVTTSLQRWSNGTANYGWIFLPTADDGVTIYSSDHATVAYHPLLSVTYNPGSLPQYTLAVTNDGNGTVALSPSGGIYSEGTIVTLTPVPSSGYAFGGWSGDNDTDLVDKGNGSWSITMNGDKSVTANFIVSTTNVAPNQPVLVQPTDSAINVSLPLNLEVTVSDPNASNTLNVDFYGRVAGEATGEDFTLVVIPDTQNAATSYPAVFNSMTQWIADNKTAENIVFATSVGDIVNSASSATEWTRADTAYDILDTANVAYSVGPGNHDLGGLYETYFGVSRFSGKDWYGGHYGSDNLNNYSLFSASGMDFILINLQYSPSTTHLDWADALLKANPNRRGIVSQHNILNTDNSWNNQASYTALKDNPNLFLMLCGHMHTSTDGAAYRAELGDDGHTIHIVMADYQDYPSGGNGYLRILRFSPSDDMIYMTTYSPYTKGSITTSPDQMNMVYDLANGSTTAYTLIDAVSGIANGANAFIPWTGLSGNTEYEWYATVSDGALTTTGSTWSFTTGSIVPTATYTPTSTPTESPVPPTVTYTPTSTPTESPIPPTVTYTPTSTPTETLVPPTETYTPTSTPTETSVPPTVTYTPTSTPTESPIPPTETYTPTSTPTETLAPPTETYTPTSTPTETSVPPTVTYTPTSTPTETLAPPTETYTPTSTPTETPVPPTVTYTPTSTPTETLVPPTETYTPTSTPTETPVPPTVT